MPTGDAPPPGTPLTPDVAPPTSEEEGSEGEPRYVGVQSGAEFLES
jgi:hypothetical protein